MASRRKYTEELLNDAVQHSTSVAGVLRYLGIGQAGGTHAHISRMIKRFGIDTSHFVRFRNGSHHRRLTPADIWVRIPFGSKRTKPYLLRRAMIESGIEHACQLCGNAGAWRDQPLTLDVDHIDGDYHNTLPENVRFLCPNCHSQTPNFAGRSRGKWATVGDLGVAGRSRPAPTTAS